MEMLNGINFVMAIEVEGIMLTLFSQERVTEIYGDEREAKGRIQNVKDMISAGLTNLGAVKASGLYTEQELATIAAP